MCSHTVRYQTSLDPAEREALEALRAAGAKRGVSYKIDPGTRGGVTLKIGGALAGFMTVDCFGGSEVESAAVLADPAHWDEMAAEVLRLAGEKQAKRVLFICDPKDTALTQTLLAKGLAPSFAEYRMVFDTAAFAPAPVGGVSLLQATAADVGYILGLDREVFGGGAEVPPGDLAATRIILQDGRPAGKLRVEHTGGVSGIYGVVVEDAKRGKGIGAAALTLLLRELAVQNPQEIYLEVDSQNPAAFHLYQKLGFCVRSEFRYYPYAR